MKRWVLVSSVVVVVFGGQPVWALDPAVNIGAIEVLGLPGPMHLGVYPYLAGSLAFPVGSVVLIPGVGVEWSPEFARWGAVGTLVADYPLGARVGLDLVITFIHDQAGAQFGDSLFFVGEGVGASFLVGDFVVSPSASAFQSLQGLGWSFVPGLNIAKNL